MARLYLNRRASAAISGKVFDWPRQKVHRHRIRLAETSMFLVATEDPAKDNPRTS